ncbi:MAG: YdbH domain-containing protein, partial [Deltaproteobacteria bacterium]|nr:YdbH domain-containing protein [Deltaproteobacteria bacterium]
MKPTFRSLPFYFLLAAILVASSLLLIPFFLNTFILPRILDKTVGAEYTATIHRLTPFTLSGSFSVAEDARHSVDIPLFKATYSMSSLLNRRLLSLTIDHGTLHLFKRGGKFAINGITNKSSQSSSQESGSLLILPFMIDVLNIKQLGIVLHEQLRPDLRITISGQKKFSFKPSSAETYQLESFSGSFELSDALSGTGEFSFKTGDSEHSATLKLQTVNQQILDRFVSNRYSYTINGPLSILAAVRFNATNMAVKSIDLQGKIPSLEAEFGPWSFTNPSDDRAIEYWLSGTPTDLSYSVQTISMDSPFHAHAAIQGSASFADGIIRSEGNVITNIELKQQEEAPLFPLIINFDTTISADRSWKLSFHADSQPKVKPILSSMNVNLEMPDFEMSGTLQGSPVRQEAVIKLTTKPFVMHEKNTEIFVADAVWRTQLQRAADTTSANFFADITEATLPSQDLLMEDITLTLPVSFPQAEQKKHAAGSFSIAATHFKKTPLFSISAELTQQGNSILLSGTVRSLLEQSLKLHFDGSANPEEKGALVNWEIPGESVSSSLLPQALGIPQALSIDGLIEAKGRFSYLKNKLSGSLQAALRSSSITHDEMNLSIEDINCALDLPSLPTLTSSPSQLCTIGSVGIGNLHFSDALVAFRLENARTLFIEKSKLKWCQGTLESGSLRLALDDREIDTTLYCNRVNFVDLLGQFGFEDIEGEGTLNGKLPINLSKKGLHFDDGFLFSTPGSGGIVRFANTEILRQGIGTISETGYLNYAMTALEDFAYNWTKLSFNSSEDELLLSMELDGKPRLPLPYGFKNGIMVETDQGSGLQYPIRLDVNFRLPLTELFEVGQNLQSIKENL